MAETLRWLVGGDVKAFYSSHWEHKHLHVGRGDARYYEGADGPLFDKSRLLDLMPLPAAASMRVVRVSGAGKDARHTAEPPKGDVATSAWTAARLDEGYTVQLFSPQRHDARLADLAARLEAAFGCLVGCSAYLTPAGCQGLAPHHDDVSVFILQTQGSKRWKLYEPLDGHAWPTRPSADLPRSRLGKLLLDVTLKPGDLLYLPRGVVHEAIASKTTFSTHLTLSTYQRFAWGDLIAEMLPHVLSSATSACLPLRRGLPLGFLGEAGSGRVAFGDASCSAALLIQAKSMLRLLSEHAECEHLGAAADAMADDFMANRLPPPTLPPPGRPGAIAAGDAGAGGGAGGMHEQGPPPIEDGVMMRLCAPAYRRLVIGSEGGEEFVTLQHCLGNSRERHMTRPRAPPMFADGEAAGVGMGEADDGGEEGEDGMADGEEGFSEEDDEEEDEEESGEDDEADDEADDGEDDASGSGSGSEGDDPSGAADATWQQLTFPKAALGPLAQLISAYPEWTRRSTLVGDDVAMVAGLLVGLWAEGVMHTTAAESTASKKAKKVQSGERAAAAKRPRKN